MEEKWLSPVDFRDFIWVVNLKDSTKVYEYDLETKKESNFLKDESNMKDIQSLGFIGAGLKFDVDRNGLFSIEHQGDNNKITYSFILCPPDSNAIKDDIPFANENRLYENLSFYQLKGGEMSIGFTRRTSSGELQVNKYQFGFNNTLVIPKVTVSVKASTEIDLSNQRIKVKAILAPKNPIDTKYNIFLRLHIQGEDKSALLPKVNFNNIANKIRGENKLVLLNTINFSNKLIEVPLQFSFKDAIKS